MPKLPLKNNPKVHNFKVLKLSHLNPTFIGETRKGNKVRETKN